MYFCTCQRIRINWHGVVCVCASVFSVISRLYCSPLYLIGGWRFLTCVLVTRCWKLSLRWCCMWGYWICNARWFWIFGLVAGKWHVSTVLVYYRTRFEHMLDLMFSQPQIRNPVEYHFRLGLEFWNASDDEWFFTRWRKSWGLRIHRRRLYTLPRCRSNTTIVSCSTRNITSGQWRGTAEELFGEVSQHVGRLQTVTARLCNR